MRVVFVTKSVGKDMLHVTSIRETQIHRIIIDNTMIEIILTVLPYILIGNAIFDFILYFSKYVFDFVNNNLNIVLQPSFRESTILHGAMRMSAGIAPSKVTRILALFSYHVRISFASCSHHYRVVVTSLSHHFYRFFVDF